MKKAKPKEGKNIKATIQNRQSKASLAGMNNPLLSSEEKITLFLLLCLIVLVVIIRSKFLLIPFERDEGAYSYYGKLLLEGKVPYKDFYEQKFPGIFYFYGIMVSLFGATVKGMHTGFMILNIATIILIYLASRKLFSPVAGLISAITFAFVSLTPNLSGFTVQSEHGVAFFTSLGLFFYACALKSKKWYNYLLMGFALGCAFMVKTSGMFFLLWGGLMLFIDFFFLKERKILHLLKPVLIYSGGAVFVIFISLLIIYLKGSFTEMIYWAYEVPKNYVGKISFEDGIKYFNMNKDAILQNHSFFWIHALLALVFSFAKGINWQTKLFAITLIFFSICPIVPGYYFYGHYWIQILPGLSLLAGLCYYSIVSLLKNQFHFKANSVRAWQYSYLILFILFTYSHISALSSYYFKPNYERILRSVYGNNPFPEAMKIGDFINQNAKPEDKMILIGGEPEIYFYTNKEAPTRHAYFSSIVSNVPEHKQWQREFVSDVEKASPKYLIFFRHPISLFVQPNSDTYIFDWLNKYIPANYNLTGVVDMIDGQQSNYVWGAEAQTYKPVSQNVIFILERKTS